MRIGREGLRRLRVRVYEIGVDKSGLLVCVKEESLRIQAIRNRRTKRLRFSVILRELGLSHRCSSSFSFLKARFGGFSFF